MQYINISPTSVDENLSSFSPGKLPPRRSRSHQKPVGKRRVELIAHELATRQVRQRSLDDHTGSFDVHASPRPFANSVDFDWKLKNDRVETSLRSLRTKPILVKKSSISSMSVGSSSSSDGEADDSDGSKKSVKFALDSKTNDGVREESRVLDAVLHTYFVLSKEVSDVDVLNVCGYDPLVVRNLLAGCHELARRVRRAPRGKGAPVLARGGGFGTQLSCPHLPYLLSLTNVVEAALARVWDAEE